jgi:ABC-type transport system involved in multi-copper enzyme maturation permease subunit
MDSIIKKARSLCAPSMWFLVITIIYIIYGIFSSYNNGVYPICFDPDRCDIFLTFAHLSLAVITMLLFTVILNVICSYGYNVIAWLLFAMLLIFRHLNGISIDITF